MSMRKKQTWVRPGKTSTVPEPLLRAIAEHTAGGGLRQGEVLQALARYVELAAQRAASEKQERGADGDQPVKRDPSSGRFAREEGRLAVATRTYIPLDLKRALSEQTGKGLRQCDILEGLVPYVSVAAQEALAAKQSPPPAEVAAEKAAADA